MRFGDLVTPRPHAFPNKFLKTKVIVILAVKTGNSPE